MVFYEISLVHRVYPCMAQFSLGFASGSIFVFHYGGGIAALLPQLHRIIVFIQFGSDWFSDSGSGQGLNQGYGYFCFGSLSLQKRRLWVNRNKERNHLNAI